MTIKPIRTDEDHAIAVARVEALWQAQPGTLEHDELEVLGVLINAYEGARWPIEAPDPVEAIKAHMDLAGYTQADLAKVIGSRSRASEILGRRRRLTVDMISALHRTWGIPADILTQPYELVRPVRASAA